MEVDGIHFIERCQGQAPMSLLLAMAIEDIIDFHQLYSPVDRDDELVHGDQWPMKRRCLMSNISFTNVNAIALIIQVTRCSMALTSIE